MFYFRNFELLGNNGGKNNFRKFKKLITKHSQYSIISGENVVIFFPTINKSLHIHVNI